MPRYAAGSTSQGTFSVDITPVSADGAAIGTLALPWSDLRLALGAVIDWDNSDVTLTHSANTLTLAGGQFITPYGIVSLPGLAVGAANTGIYGSATAVQFTLAGTQVFQFDNNNNLILTSTTGAIILGDGNGPVLRRDGDDNILQLGTDAASPATQTLKGSDARAGTDTNTVGGRINWRTGLSTGTGVPALGVLQGGAASVTSGTTAHTVVDRFVSNAFRVLTNNSAIGVVDTTIANGTSVGGKIVYTIEVWDGTDNQVEIGEVNYKARNKAGVVVASLSELNSAQEVDSGTLATTWAISNANPAVISINANSSLTPSTGYPRITYAVFNLGQQAITI